MEITRQKEDLIVDAQDSYQRLKASRMDMINETMYFGKTLIQIKAQCKHGEWQVILDELIGVSRQHAGRVMKVYETYKDKPSEVNGATYSALWGSIKQAQKKKEQLPSEQTIDAEIVETEQESEVNEPDEAEVDEPEVETENVYDLKSSTRDIISSLSSSISSILEEKECRDFDDEEKALLKRLGNKLISCHKDLRDIYDPKRTPEKVIVESKLPREQATEAIELLMESIQANCGNEVVRTLPAPSAAMYDSWIKEIQGLSVKYNADLDRIKEVIAWVKVDEGNGKFPGWGKVIRSARKFKEKYPQITDQMAWKGDKPKKGRQIATPDGKRWGNGD